MFIEEEVLMFWGATLKEYKKGEYIFYEGDHSKYYYQIKEGKIKMINLNSEGKEFIQGEFSMGCSFGEPVLFINETYPASAIASCDTWMFVLPKEYFLKQISTSADLLKRMVVVLATRLYGKALTSKEMVSHTPEMRILGFLKAYKKRIGKEDEKIFIPHTRQEIANFTGLRVETVIRTLMKMKDANKVEIIDHKLKF